ncbi:uncharacterized protein EAF02_004416 [Botrytis sinoallii]|uniref:uncharacterized protein n=1 Tax=Botrytis sinoallii TaxID=1463999 RepID=UPI001900C33D|nr:uncharacterized protein EAF02_004416 [Botrytis sinoallii]KAF7885907.1 hypothetical protein EAF02_004416 [Botrytis sinoallii]
MSRFILTESSRLNVDTLIRMALKALRRFGSCEQLWKSVSAEDELQWLKSAFARYYTMDDMSRIIVGLKAFR